MAEWYRLDVSEMEKLQDAINRSTQQAGPVIDAVLRNEGAQKIKKNIAMILPSSGRNWKGKGAPASAAMPAHFKQENGMLSVTIVARGKYHYLYFPDDGSNTRRHAGNQQFMRRGAEAASVSIVDMCVGRLIDNFEGG